MECDTRWTVALLPSPAGSGFIDNWFSSACNIFKLVLPTVLAYCIPRLHHLSCSQVKFSSHVVIHLICTTIMHGLQWISMIYILVVDSKDFPRLCGMEWSTIIQLCRIGDKIASMDKTTKSFSCKCCLIYCNMYQQMFKICDCRTTEQ